MYALVEFLQSNSIAVVPLSWIKEENCYWPNVKDVAKLSKAMQNPKDDWKPYKIYIKGVYATYDDAKAKEKKFENVSNLDSTDTEDLGKGKRGQKRPYRASSSDDETPNFSQMFSVCGETPQHVPALDFPPVPPVCESPRQSQAECSFTLSTSTVPPKEKYEVIEPAPPAVSGLSRSGKNTVTSEIYRDVVHMKLVLKDHGDTLSDILTALNNLQDKLTPASNLRNDRTLPVTLPLQSTEDLSLLEEALNEEGLQDYLCEKLSQIGGSSLGNAVRRMMMKVMTNELATNFSWMGMKGKYPLSTLKTTAVLISAVRKNRMYCNCSNSEIENIIKDWLRHAKARCKQ